MSAAIEIERVDDVRGWPLSVIRGEERPLIKDEVLGHRLGMAARSIDRLIDRMEAAGSLGKVLRHRVAKPSGGRPAVIRLLTRSQSLKIVMRSETDVADRIQDEILEVYEAWLDGQLRMELEASRKSSQAAMSGAVLALGARVADNQIARSDLSSKLRLYANAAGISRQAAEGRLRREFQVVSYLRLPLVSYPTAATQIVQWAESPHAAPRLGAARAHSQLNLFASIIAEAA